MKEMLLTDRQYEKLICFFSDMCKKLGKNKSLSDKVRYNEAMNCLDMLSSVENTQYDEQYCGISINISEEQKEKIICSIIDLI